MTKLRRLHLFLTSARISRSRTHSNPATHRQSTGISNSTVLSSRCSCLYNPRSLVRLALSNILVARHVPPQGQSRALSCSPCPRAKNTPFCVLLESCICAIAIPRRSPDITVRGRCSAMRLWAVGRGGGLIQARTLTLTLVFFFFPSAVSTILRSGGARPDVLAPASPK